MSRPHVRTNASETRPGLLGIGDALRRRREALDISLEQVHDRIRIPVASLRDLEDERFDAFAAPQYAKGFLRSYAEFLDLDPQPLIDRLGTVLGGDRKPELIARSGEVPIRPAAPPSPLRRLVRWGLLALVVLFGVVAYVGYREIRAFYATPVVTQEPVVMTPERPARDPVAAELSPQLPPPPPQPVNGVRLALHAADVSWLRVVADDRRVFEGFVRPGESKVWDGKQTVSVVIGNASAVTVVVNGRDLGALGGPGEVVRRTFTSAQTAPSVP
jgi:hypothetical protein